MSFSLRVSLHFEKTRANIFSGGVMDKMDDLVVSWTFSSPFHRDDAELSRIHRTERQTSTI